MSQLIYNGVAYEINDNLSYKDFTGHDLSHRKDLSGSIIYASCFSNETPDSLIFPKGMTGVTFIRCNLSNLKIPDGNTVIDCNQTRFKCQNDLRDWEIDTENKPIKVMNEKHEMAIGRSVDPKDIPLEKLTSFEQIKKVGG